MKNGRKSIRHKINDPEAELFYQVQCKMGEIIMLKIADNVRSELRTAWAVHDEMFETFFIRP
jgi:hypothetical protein